MKKPQQRLQATTIACLFLCATSQAQVKLGDNVNLIDPAAHLELSNSNGSAKGLLLSKISLSTTSTWGLDGTGGSDQKGMVVYNTNAAITGSSAQGAGFYVWDGSQWRAMVISGSEWNAKGNAGTVPGTNFLGTTDDNTLVFKTNSRNAARIENGTSGLSNTSFGAFASDSLTTGAGNTSAGAGALVRNKTGNSNVAIGAGALRNNVVSKIVAVGDSALYSFNSAFATGNTAIGSKALYTTQTGRKNTAVGFQAGMSNNNGSNNTFVGEVAGYSFSGADRNTIVGDSAAFSMTGGAGNVIIGHLAGAAKTGGLENILIGTEAGKNNGGASQSLMIGVRAGYNAPGTIPFPFGNQNQFIGYNAGYNQSSGVQNMFEGFQSGYSSTGGWQNTYLGAFTGYSGTADSNNVFVGNSAGYRNMASRNHFVGFFAGSNNTTGTENHFEGHRSGQNTSTGSLNTAAGSNALSGNTTGSSNVALGAYAGNNAFTGGNNTFIGYQANGSAAALSNATAIGSNAQVGASNSLVLGGINANAVNVGIGVAAPSSTLHVLGESAPPMVNVESGLTSSANDLRSGALRLGYSEGGQKEGVDMFVVDGEMHIAHFYNSAAGTQDTSGFIIRDNITANHFSSSKNTAYPGMYNAATLVNYGSYAGQVKSINNASTNAGVYTPDRDDNLLLVNTDANITVQLPSPNAATGRYLTVKRTSAGANTLTLNAGAATIDGAATQSISVQYQYLTLVSDGSNWFVVAK